MDDSRGRFGSVLLFAVEGEGEASVSEWERLRDGPNGDKRGCNSVSVVIVKVSGSKVETEGNCCCGFTDDDWVWLEGRLSAPLLS